MLAFLPCHFPHLQAAWCVSGIVPTGLTFFASPHPVVSGPGLTQGVAVLTTPQESWDKHRAVRPGYFVFNAGTLAGPHSVRPANCYD